MVHCPRHTVIMISALSGTLCGPILEPLVFLDKVPSCLRGSEQSSEGLRGWAGTIGVGVLVWGACDPGWVHANVDAWNPGLAWQQMGGVMVMVPRVTGMWDTYLVNT